jgi:hypothetical protein
MVYLPNIPVSTNSPAVDQPLITANFTAANNFFGVDHVKFDAASNNGRHNQISFVGVNPAAAVPVATEGITLIAEYDAVSSKYVLNYRQDSAAHPAEAAYALTNSNPPLVAGIGYSYLPGGILLQWGRTAADVVSGVQTTISFPIAFTAIAYSVQATLEKDNPASGSGQAVNVVKGKVTTTGFDVWHQATGNHKVQWMAIGVCA